MPKKNPSGIIIDHMRVNGVLIYFDDGGKEMEKTCPKCNTRLPLSAFGLRCISAKVDDVPGYIIRLQPWCRECR